MTTTAPRPTLADVRAADLEVRTAEVDRVVVVTDWLEDHLVDPRTSDDVSMPDYGDGELMLAGDGAPAVSEVAVVELITTLGKSDAAGRRFVGKCLQLKYRLPRLWQRVLDGEVEVWTAFKIAESTLSLPLDGAAFVDGALAPFAHSLTWSQLERTVEKARAEFDPDEVQRRRDADPRHFDVRTESAGVDGFVWVEGLLDAGDALDIDAAVSAAQLGEVSDLPLDVRRSMAAGEIGRAQLALDLTDTSQTGRGVDVSILMTESQVAELRQTGTHVLLDQVASWCGSATSVTVRPVLDLDDHHRHRDPHRLHLDQPRRPPVPRRPPRLDPTARRLTTEPHTPPTGGAIGTPWASAAGAARLPFRARFSARPPGTSRSLRRPALLSTQFRSGASRGRRAHNPDAGASFVRHRRRQQRAPEDRREQRVPPARRARAARPRHRAGARAQERRAVGRGVDGGEPAPGDDRGPRWALPES